jgi:hypothetical protein
MAKTREKLLALLNSDQALENLKSLLETEPAPVVGRDVNNHIHTTYSFSPYNPTAAVYMAWQNGLKTAGIIDHDSVSGARSLAETLSLESRFSRRK